MPNNNFCAKINVNATKVTAKVKVKAILLITQQQLAETKDNCLKLNLFKSHAS